MVSKINDQLKDRLAGLLRRHLVPLYFEDSFYSGLYESLKAIKDRDKMHHTFYEYDFISRHGEVIDAIEEARKALFPMISSRNVEPVRLGIYKSLFLESYSYRYDVRRIFTFTYHGVFREHLKKIKDLRISSDKIPTGIDLVFFIRFPLSSIGKEYVVLPYIIIAKYDEKKAIEEVRLEEAVGEAKGLLEQLKEEDVCSDAENCLGEEKALQYIQDFARIALLMVKLPPIGIPDKCKKDRTINNLVVYRDFACSVLYPILEDIPSLYREIENGALNEVLDLGLEDWFKALLTLSTIARIPPMAVVIDSKKPPKPPDGSGGSILVDIIRKLREERNKALEECLYEMMEMYHEEKIKDSSKKLALKI